MKIAYLYTKEETPWIRIVCNFTSPDSLFIRGIPGAKYRKDFGWVIPVSPPNVQLLLDHGFELSDKLQRYWDSEKPKKTFPKIVRKMPELKFIPGLNGELRPFQFGGVDWIEWNKGRALIADEMGLGKTVQALAWLQLHPEIRPVLIVCPASLKWNWEREIRKWLSPVPEIFIVSGTKAHPVYCPGITIINYDVMAGWRKELIDVHFRAVIMDEAHYIKTNSALRTKATKSVCKTIPYIVGLTGTPIENKPSEIFNIVNLIHPGLFKNQWEFLHRYCNAKHNGFGWTFNGATHVEELHQILTTNVMIRRLKKNVLKELPEKIYNVIPLDIDNRKEYLEAKMDFVAYMGKVFDRDVEKMKQKLGKEFQEFAKQQNLSGVPAPTIDIDELNYLREEKMEKVANAPVLTQIENLKQIAVRGKMKQLINWIHEFLESGEKLVVMAVHRFVIDELMEEFGKVAVKVDGGVSGKKRQDAVDVFQSSSRIKLFIGNIKAAGVGLTLTAACNIAVIELPWAPGELDQAVDRVHRISQLRGVNVYYIVSRQTIEEEIAEMLDRKRKVLSQTLDGANVDSSTLLSEILSLF